MRHGRWLLSAVAVSATAIGCGGESGDGSAAAGGAGTESASAGATVSSGTGAAGTGASGVGGSISGSGGTGAGATGGAGGEAGTCPETAACNFPGCPACAGSCLYFYCCATDEPVELATISFPGTTVYDVDSFGNRAMVATVDGVLLYDIAAPASPVLLDDATGGYPHVVAFADGQTVYAADLGGSLWAIDVSNPSQVTSLPEITVAGSSHVVDIAPKGSHAVVATFSNAGGSNSVRIFDFGTPAAPQHMGTVTIPGEVIAMAVSGDYAYTQTSDPDNLYVVSIANPTAPTIVSSFASSAFDVAVGGGFLFTDHHLYGLSNPADPQLVDPLSDSGDYNQAAGGDLAVLGQQLIGGYNTVGGFTVNSGVPIWKYKSIDDNLTFVATEVTDSDLFLVAGHEYENYWVFVVDPPDCGY